MQIYLWKTRVARRRRTRYSTVMQSSFLGRILAHRIFKALVIGSALASGFFVFAPVASAVTFVDNDIVANTTWAIAGSPYVIKNGPTVQPGATLIIEPGVVVKFADT